MKTERTHLAQIEKAGRVVFTMMWWTMRFGDYNNPYEAEARIAELGEA